MAVNRDAVSSSPGSGSGALQVPLLGETLARLTAGERMVVLDLAPPRAATVAYLSAYRCRLGIADALGELADTGAVLEGRDMGEPLGQALPPHFFAGSELILCWGLLDYLSPDGIRALGEHLLSLAVSGTILHALVAYGVSRIPSRPVGYALAADGVHAARPPPDDPGRRPPRHSSGELQRWLPDWRMERSVLLRNGLQEYRFQC